MSSTASAPKPRPCVSGRAGYIAPPSSENVVWDLAGNEGTGPSAAFIAETLSGWAERVRRYPSPAPLGAKLAARLGVTPEQIVLTPGADDALDRVCRVVLEPGRNLVLPGPTFEMIERYGAVAGAEVRHVDWSGALTAAVLAPAVDAATGLIALVTPNNPTGRTIERSDLFEICERWPETLVLADLAYVEFADNDPTAALLRYPNVVITRTLSKAWGLASLRVGYAVSSTAIAGWLRAAAGPYGVSGPSLAIAEAWLDAGERATEDYVARVKAERGPLAARLAARGWTVLPSQANFVTVDSPSAPRLGERLLASGVRIRTWPHDPVRSRYARITCPASEEALDALLAAIPDYETTP